MHLPAPAHDGWIREPRLFLDPRLLGALHRELRRRLGEEEVGEVLLQAGFVHGLSDAMRLLRAAEDGAATPIAPHLPLDLGLCNRETTASGNIELNLRGTFPERVEAEAVIAGLGRRAEPSCQISIGYVSGWLSGLWERDMVAVEERCAAADSDRCVFVARSPRAWVRQPSASSERQLRSLPFADLRRAAQHYAATAPDAVVELPVHDTKPTICVWESIMVVPYAGEETIQAVQAVTRASHTPIDVVVLNLDGAVVDDGFETVSLERVVDAIQEGGAEAVLVGASPLSGRVLEQFGRAGLLVRDDLSQGIAAAFQVSQFLRLGM